MASNPHGAFKIYKTVIDDTINNVREAFLDEGIDEQILLELKQIWETKLVQSRAVDTGVPQQPHHVQSYHDIQVAAAAQQAKVEQEQAAKAAAAASKKSRQQTQQQGVQQQTTSYIDSTPSASSQLSSTLTPQAAAATLALPQGVLQLQPHQLAQLPAGLTLPGGVTVGGQQFPAYQVQGGSGFQIVQQPGDAGQLQPGQVITFTTQSGGTGTIQGNVLQVDGGNDTSDEEDEYDDDDNDDNDDEEGEDKDDLQNDVEEEPLNSDDDVSDEDATELFETDNVVVCQYDRINRNRNKWKFTLKSGIMNLKGKDHVFFKATGDAEW